MIEVPLFLVLNSYSETTNATVVGDTGFSRKFQELYVSVISLSLGPYIFMVSSQVIKLIKAVNERLQHFLDEEQRKLELVKTELTAHYSSLFNPERVKTENHKRDTISGVCWCVLVECAKMNRLTVQAEIVPGILMFGQASFLNKDELSRCYTQLASACFPSSELSNENHSIESSAMNIRNSVVAINMPKITLVSSPNTPRVLDTTDLPILLELSKPTFPWNLNIGPINAFLFQPSSGKTLSIARCHSITSKLESVAEQDIVSAFSAEIKSEGINILLFPYSFHLFQEVFATLVDDSNFDDTASFYEVTDDCDGKYYDNTHHNSNCKISSSNYPENLHIHSADLLEKERYSELQLFGIPLIAGQLQISMITVAFQRSVCDGISNYWQHVDAILHQIECLWESKLPESIELSLEKISLTAAKSAGARLLILETTPSTKTAPVSHAPVFIHGFMSKSNITNIQIVFGAVISVCWLPALQPIKDVMSTLETRYNLLCTSQVKLNGVSDKLLKDYPKVNNEHLHEASSTSVDSPKHLLIEVDVNICTDTLTFAFPVSDPSISGGEYSVPSCFLASFRCIQFAAHRSSSKPIPIIQPSAMTSQQPTMAFDVKDNLSFEISNEKDQCDNVGVCLPKVDLFPGKTLLESFQDRIQFSEGENRQHKDPTTVHQSCGASVGAKVAIPKRYELLTKHHQIEISVYDLALHSVSSKDANNENLDAEIYAEICTGRHALWLVITKANESTGKFREPILPAITLHASLKPRFQQTWSDSEQPSRFAAQNKPSTLMHHEFSVKAPHSILAFISDEQLTMFFQAATKNFLFESCSFSEQIDDLCLRNIDTKINDISGSSLSSPLSCDYHTEHNLCDEQTQRFRESSQKESIYTGVNLENCYFQKADNSNTAEKRTTSQKYKHRRTGSAASAYSFASTASSLLFGEDPDFMICDINLHLPKVTLVAYQVAKTKNGNEQAYYTNDIASLVRSSLNKQGRSFDYPTRSDVVNVVGIAVPIFKIDVDQTSMYASVLQSGISISVHVSALSVTTQPNDKVLPCIRLASEMLHDSLWQHVIFAVRVPESNPLGSTTEMNAALGISASLPLFGTTEITLDFQQEISIHIPEMLVKVFITEFFKQSNFLNSMPSIKQHVHEGRNTACNKLQRSSATTLDSETFKLQVRTRPVCIRFSGIQSDPWEVLMNTNHLSFDIKRSSCLNQAGTIALSTSIIVHMIGLSLYGGTDDPTHLLSLIRPGACLGFHVSDHSYFHCLVQFTFFFF